MAAPRHQRTLAQAAEVRGIGYWSGRDVRVEFRPALPDTGLVFVRGDVPSHPRIPALVSYRVDQPRRTVLSSQGVTVEMVEHILAALAGLQVDNCEIWVDAPEMPGVDGSSLPFVAALDRAGIVTQPVARSQLVVREVTRLGDDDCWIEARPHESGLALRYRLDYGPGNAVGRQSLGLELTEERFRRELAPSRTFLLHREAEALKLQGLGLRATYRDLLVFGDDGPIDNPLRFPDECVRHKTLDLCGDLALAGCDLVGEFSAYRSGHRLNAELVKVLLAEGEWIGSHRRSA